MRSTEKKWWVSFTIDLLLFLSFCFTYFSLPLPHVALFGYSNNNEVASAYIVYGWQDSNLWGWIFPHTAFFFAFLLQRNAPERLLRIFVFYELLFGIMSITIGPTATAQHQYGQKNISPVGFDLKSGSILLLFAYILGAVAALLQLVLTIRTIEDDVGGPGVPAFGVNITGSYESQSAVAGYQSGTGYQSLSDAPAPQQPAPQHNSHYNSAPPSYPAPQQYGSAAPTYSSYQASPPHEPSQPTQSVNIIS
eukprot:Phypoly_transcript_17061.p1 GENE.Phypoly_transcript_17061~~Phypoly_transcript_17061.p1  ORF type:complete len:250 (+),score=32.02 Phypoly_transcript_17061:45-794(+)